MNILYKLVIALICSGSISILSGCWQAMPIIAVDSLIYSPTYWEADELNENGLFEINEILIKNGVIYEEPFMPIYHNLIYVKNVEIEGRIINYHDKFNSFLFDSFKNMNVFDDVLNQEQLESLVLKRGLAEKVSNLCDREGLYRLSRVIGPFLVVETSIETVAKRDGTMPSKIQFKVFNASTGEDVLILQNRTKRFTEDSLFFPAFNAFLQWVRGEEIKMSGRSFAEPVR